MSDARVRLLKAREALSRAENSVGLRGRVDIEVPRASGTRAPVLLGPQDRGRLIRILIDACPPDGWIGLCGVRHIGWEWAALQGVDLDRVLVLSPREGTNVGQLCALLLDACDVVCLDVAELTHSECRTLAARARSLGRTLVTLRAWPGLSRAMTGVGQRRAVV